MGTITANFIKPRALINLLLQISSERGMRDYPRHGRQQAAARPFPAPGPGHPGPSGGGPTGARQDKVPVCHCLVGPSKLEKV